MRRVSRKSVGVSHICVAAWVLLAGALPPAPTGRVFCRRYARALPHLHVSSVSVPARRCRHGFPRSHGPAEERTRRQWLKLGCRHYPPPRTELSMRPGPIKQFCSKMPIEPESRRNPRQSQIGGASPRRSAWPGAGANDPAGQNTEQAREPQKSWRVRDRMPATGVAAEVLVCWQRAFSNPIVRALEPEETR
jgi:hypothetical protein